MLQESVQLVRNEDKTDYCINDDGIFITRVDYVYRSLGFEKEIDV